MRCPRTGLKVKLVEVHFQSFYLEREDEKCFNAFLSEAVWHDFRWLPKTSTWIYWGSSEELQEAFKCYSDSLVDNWLVEGF